MDDILKRLGVVEAAVVAQSGDVREVKGHLPHLATKADVQAVRVEVAEVRVEVSRVEGTLTAHLNKVEGAVGGIKAEIQAQFKWIKWFVAAALAVCSLAIAIVGLSR